MGAQPVNVVPENLATGCAQAMMPLKSNRLQSTDFAIKDFKQDWAFITVLMVNKKSVAIFYSDIKIWKCNQVKARCRQRLETVARSLVSAYKTLSYQEAYSSNEKTGILL